jgi:hypothetical protein
MVTARCQLILDFVPLFPVLFIRVLFEYIVEPFCWLVEGHFIVLFEHNWGHHPLLTVFVIVILSWISLYFELVSVFYWSFCRILEVDGDGDRKHTVTSVVYLVRWRLNSYN